jgi:hypothetical protein
MDVNYDDRAQLVPTTVALDADDDVDLSTRGLSDARMHNTLTLLQSQATRVRSLYMFKNRLRQVPTSLSCFHNLTILWLGNNNVTNITHLQHCSRLTTLDLTNNKLRLIPDSIGTSLSKLTKLWLAHNTLITLPRNISNLCSLHTMYLNNNALRALPTTLTALTNLHTINLMNNPQLAEHLQRETTMDRDSTQILLRNVCDDFVGHDRCRSAALLWITWVNVFPNEIKRLVGEFVMSTRNDAAWSKSIE